MEQNLEEANCLLPMGALATQVRDFQEERVAWEQTLDILLEQE